MHTHALTVTCDITSVYTVSPALLPLPALSSCPQPALVARWRSTALRRNVRSAWQLAVSCSLCQHLLSSLGGWRAAKRFLTHYHKHAVDAITLALADDVPTSSSKPNLFHVRDWLHSSSPV